MFELCCFFPSKFLNHRKFIYRIMKKGQSRSCVCCVHRSSTRRFFSLQFWWTLKKKECLPEKRWLFCYFLFHVLCITYSKNNYYIHMLGTYYFFDNIFCYLELPSLQSRECQPNFWRSAAIKIATTCLKLLMIVVVVRTSKFFFIIPMLRHLETRKSPSEASPVQIFTMPAEIRKEFNVCGKS